MFFEGSEKKLEMIFNPKMGNLLEWPRQRWVDLVAASNAQILSEISNESCIAFLLSESSLFVWSDRIVMITCGETTLVNAAKKMLTWVDCDLVDCLVFERKNEYHPHLQKTNFFQDAAELEKIMPVNAFRFGNADEHHLHLLTQCRDYTPPAGDKTLEILMYDLAPEVQGILSVPGQDPEKIRDLVNLEGALPGFDIDDYVFQPVGYSLNALKGECYYTMHITPQEEGSYVSFETNIPVSGGYQNLVEQVISRFRPRTFDVVTFTERPSELGEFGSFTLLNSVYGRLNCGYDVSYFNYGKPCPEFSKPYEIKLKKEGLL